MYETYSQDRAHIPAIQTPTPHRMMQELIQAYGRGRGQACREQLHEHRPFGVHTRSLQSRIQRKIKKTHETEICKYPVRLFHFCNNPICV